MCRGHRTLLPALPPCPQESRTTLKWYVCSPRKKKVQRNIVCGHKTFKRLFSAVPPPPFEQVHKRRGGWGADFIPPQPPAMCCKFRRELLCQRALPPPPLPPRTWEGSRDTATGYWCNHVTSKQLFLSHTITSLLWFTTSSLLARPAWKLGFLWSFSP